MVVKPRRRLHHGRRGSATTCARPHLPDGVHWTEQGPFDIRLTSGEPIPAGARGTPVLWFENGTQYLFYERGDAGVWLATSKDGKVWANVQDDPVIAKGPGESDKFAVAMNQVIKYRGRYYVFYHRLRYAGVERVEHERRDERRPDPLDEVSEEPAAAREQVERVRRARRPGWRLYTMHDKVQLHTSAVESDAGE